MQRMTAEACQPDSMIAVQLGPHMECATILPGSTLVSLPSGGTAVPEAVVAQVRETSCRDLAYCDACPLSLPILYLWLQNISDMCASASLITASKPTLVNTKALLLLFKKHISSIYICMVGRAGTLYVLVSTSATYFVRVASIVSSDNMWPTMTRCMTGIAQMKQLIKTWNDWLATGKIWSKLVTV